MADSTALNVLLTADFKRLAADLAQAGLLAEKSVADIEDKFAKANPKLSIGPSLIAGFAGGAAMAVVSAMVSKLSELPTKIIEANQELARLGDTAHRIGTSTDALQKIQYVGAQNGISAADTEKSMQGFASALAGANEEGSKLGKLLADNGIKINDASGKQRDLNSLLTESASLFQGAANQQEKIDIAKLLGLSQEWIAVLERGPEAFQLGQAAAVATGNVIDKEIIQRAKDFDTYWSQSFSNFETWAKTAAINATSEFRKFLAVANLANDPTALQQQKLQYQSTVDKYGADSLKGSLAQTGLNDIDAKIDAQLAPAKEVAKKALALAMASQAGVTGSSSDPAFGNLIRPKKTDVSALAKAGKGASGSSSDDTDAVDRYLLQLQKSVEILDAEAASLGKTRAEKTLSVELAKAEAAARQAGVQLSAEDIQKTTELAAKKAQLNQVLADFQQKQQQVNELGGFVGNQLVDAFDSILTKGGSVTQVLDSITSALLKAALQAAILGQGPLAGLLGSASTAGGTSSLGGIIGSFFNSAGARASGGPVQSGKTYLVGENGPEMVRFGQNGTVMPNSVIAGGGGGGAPNIQIINQSSAQVETRDVGKGPDGRLMIRMLIREEFGTDISKNGPMAQMLQGRYRINRMGGKG
ncbi:MAG: hypothetical protein JWM36_4336 [Hyphomicrobiales bacterium]|nr:hypothetical protein [Hyphomicrobiales bacterium]